MRFFAAPWIFIFGLKFLNSATGVAVPCLAAGALPKMLARLKAASGAAVAGERRTGAVKGALHLGVKLLVFEFFGCQPFGGRDQRGFAL